MSEVSSVHINQASVEDMSCLDIQVLLASREYMISRVKWGREWTYAIDRTKKISRKIARKEKCLTQIYGSIDGDI